MRITRFFERADGISRRYGYRAQLIYIASQPCHRHNGEFHGEGRTPQEAVRNMRAHVRFSHGRTRKKIW